MAPTPIKASQPVCPACRGTGWRLLSAADGGEASRCDCRLSERSQGLLEEAGIPKRYQQCVFSAFQSVPGSEINAALMLASAFAREYPEEDRRNGLLLVGPVGVGKTHLAVSLAHALIEEKGVSCRFCDYRELLKRIQATFDSSNPATEAGVVAPLLDTEVLILDDVGVGRATEWALETLHYILNTRYSQERTTILTTNYEDAEAPGRPSLKEAVGERLYSRLFEMCRLVPMHGDDFRRRLAVERRLR
jgi:DNA replication protein DnaC